MNDSELMDRLVSLPAFAQIPREELQWLISHGRLDEKETGTIIATRGKRIEDLWIVFSGHIAIRVDRGAGLHRVMEWRRGDVGGILPYSRMSGPPGDAYLEEKGEIFLIHEKHFSEMIRQCPVFTAHTVHVMIDRARAFNTSELQDEKMISLGKLAAGLAHELNNPASATVRSAKLLLEELPLADSAARSLGSAVVNEEAMQVIEQTRSACMSAPAGNVLSPVEQADREDTFDDWLTRHNLDPACATSLAESHITIEALDTLAAKISAETLDSAIRWIAAGCSTYSLAVDIERAAARIYELVAAVKRFTYMDKLAGSDSADIETGLRDTIRVVAFKTKEKGASITLDIAPGLPPAHANGGVLNQVWLNLIDNALDAIPHSGRIDISARQEFDRIVVRLVDNGTGIPVEIAALIFDPFFTTKPPGQGTGLGLDITRRLLRRYHGDISFTSQPGCTEFLVRLLIEKPAVPLGDPPLGGESGE